MSQEVELKEIPKELDIETIKKLVEKASSTESKFILKLRLDRRRGGCGYVYRWWTSLDIVHGDADIVNLSTQFSDECTWVEDVLVIPKAVPTILVRTYRDDDPQVRNYAEIYIFDKDGWKSVRVDIPK